MLFLQDAVRQRLRRIPGKNGHDRLNNDRPRIHALIDKMNRAARKPDAVIQRLLLNVCSREGGKQGGVNVDDPVRKGSQEKWRQDPHESRQHHQFDACVRENAEQFAVKIFAVFKILMVQNRAGNSMLLRPGQTIGFGIVADDHGDPGVKRSPFNLIDDGLKVGAASGNQNTQL
ncbi:MAG: hypothetical protein BWY31_04794 [Lentisphaerae bacterium ADurb.Bin242]|nr:MAG: hypothetical protein BWY31_04794 [Lentisphaerae bacterium ADurb.Bin242]